MSVTLFTGKPGSGKSYRVVCKLLDDCNRYFIFHNIDGLKHDFFGDGRFIRRWDDIDGFLSLSKQKELSAYCESEFKRPMLVVVDEANLNGFGARNNALLGWISYHRHIGQDIYLISQSAYSIHRDYVDRCQFEVRAKRGIATKMFVYQYLVGDEVFKTDRVPVKKAMFAAYDSFNVKGVAPPRSRILVYAVCLIVLVLIMGVYQVTYGLPHLFGGKVVKKGVPSSAVVSKPPNYKPVVPVVAVVPPKPKSPTILKDYSLCFVSGENVWVQSLADGCLISLGEVVPDYGFVSYDRVKGCCKVVDSSGVEYLVSKRRMASKRVEAGLGGEVSAGVESKSTTKGHK